MSVNDFDFSMLPSQESIKSKWVVGDDVKVSVIVTCYNHGPYIFDCLKGILMQVTNFPFEVIIHDDASSDSSVEKINLFCKNYPELIKPIFQIENQYSKGCNIPLLISASHSDSKYIAICEGDDFWVNPYKLQRQFDVIEANAGCSIVVHEASIIYSGKTKRFNRPIDCERFGVKQVLCKFGQFAPTASYFFEKGVFDILPPWFKTASVGDFLIEVYSQKLGFGIYLKGYDSVYRYLSNGSWTSRVSVSNDSRYKAIESLIEIYDLVPIDFPDFYDDINSRKFKAYGALAFQIARLNFREIFKGSNNSRYLAIRDLALSVGGASFVNRFLIFPAWYPLFIVRYVLFVALNRL